MIEAWNIFWSSFSSLIRATGYICSSFEKGGRMLDTTIGIEEKKFEIRHKGELDQLIKQLESAPEKKVILYHES